MNAMKKTNRHKAEYDTSWISRLAHEESGGSPMEQVLVAALCAAVFGLFLLAIRK